MRTLILVCLVLAARLSSAHDVPVTPSTCTFDQVQLVGADGGPSATVAPPTPADAMRIAYTVATSTAQFQQRIVAPHAFSIAGVAGTIAVPQAFNAQLTTGGDLSADDVALDVVLGGVAATVPVHLTTAVVVAGSGVEAGAPIGTDGRFSLVGVAPAGTLPAPLNASPTVLRFGCQANPAPDVDQFALAPTFTSFAGMLSATRGKLRGTLAGGALTATSFTGGEAILHLEVAGGGRATFEFPDGFRAQGARLLVAETADGARMTLRLGKGRSPARLEADLPGQQSAVPPASTGSVQVDATLVAGPVTARAGRPFRARGGTLRAGS